MKPILKWQRDQISKELLLLQGHVSDPTCPCKTEGEKCVRKHLLTIEALAQETIPIEDSDARAEELAQLANEARELREEEEKNLCGQKAHYKWPIDTWSRNWRKKFETLACEMKAGMRQKAVMCQTLPVTVSGVCERGGSCTIKVRAATAVEEQTSISKLGDAINRVRKQTGEAKPAPVSDRTYAVGPGSMKRYEFRHRLVEADKLIVSHDPVTFEPNKHYPAELQPRLRERQANRSQVQQIARNLDAEALLTDYHSIDRGTPIIGPDNVVESGNGRTMAIKLAVEQFPDSYARYKAQVTARAGSLGLSEDEARSMKHPVVARERLSSVSRREFVEEANASTTLAPSGIEVARSDARKITPEMLNTLIVGDEQSVEDALRGTANRPFVSSFLGKLPQNEIAQISDKYGAINQDGIRRLVMAVFVAAFPGDAGLGLAEKFYESTEPAIRNIANGIGQALGKIAKVEARSKDLAIGKDLAAAARVFAEVKKSPGMTVEKYLAQGQMFEKQLNAFQEQLLKLLDERARSGKKVGSLLKAYCDIALEVPPPEQAGLLPGMTRMTKQDALAAAIKRADETANGPRMFQTAVSTTECSALREAEKTLHAAAKSLDTYRGNLVKIAGKLGTVKNICSGQSSMFQGEKTMEAQMEAKPTCGKISISGRCHGGVESCRFKLTRKCSPVAVKGVEELKKTYRDLTGQDLTSLPNITFRPSLNQEPAKTAQMEICPACMVALADEPHTMNPKDSWSNARGIDKQGDYLHALGGKKWEALTAVDRSRLIAAAPRMLDALVAIADARTRKDTKHDELVAILVAIAKVAVADAKGHAHMHSSEAVTCPSANPPVAATTGG